MMRHKVMRSGLICDCDDLRSFVPDSNLNEEITCPWCLSDISSNYLVRFFEATTSKILSICESREFLILYELRIQQLLS
jgi:hypothetical protein